MDITKIKKYRLKAGAYAVLRELQDIKTEDLIFQLYLPVKDDDTRKLITFFEKQLILAKVDQERFMKTRYQQIQEKVQWIKKNNKYRLFADFSMYVMRNLDKCHNVLCAYQDMLMDVWTNLSPFETYWYGLDKNDKPLIMPSLYWAYDAELYDLLERHKKASLQEKLIIEQRMLEYDLKTNPIAMNERNITNIIYAMIGLINEENQDFIFPGQNWFNHYEVVYNFPQKIHDNNYYLDLLDQRHYFLDPEGVIIQCFNTGIFKEIRFKEEFLEDGMLVLFRVTNEEDKHTMGFIDLRDKFIYCIGTYAEEAHPIFGSYKENFINFILEVYCLLTHDNKITPLKFLKEPNTTTDEPAIYVYTKTTKSGSQRQGYKSGPRSLHYVNAFLRRGNASEMAKANARLYGIIVPQGYTFVRPHWRGRKKET
jgi:hypothetical protein